MYFAITGETEKGKRALSEMIRENGHHVGDFVCERTDYLIANSPSMTRKYRNAIEYKIPIITEKECIKMFDKNESYVIK